MSLHLPQMVTALEQALKQKTEGKARGMQMIFAKFDSYKSLWSAAIQATAMLDALGAISVFSTTPGFSRAEILYCGSTSNPTIEVEQGRHPVSGILSYVVMLFLFIIFFLTLFKFCFLGYDTYYSVLR